MGRYKPVGSRRERSQARRREAREREWDGTRVGTGPGRVPSFPSSMVEETGGKDGSQRGHRRTTRTRRPQIRYHLATTNVICMRMSSLRHELVRGKKEKKRREEKRREEKQDRQREKNVEEREKGKGGSALRLFFFFFFFFCFHPLRSPTFADLRGWQSVDNTSLRNFFFLVGISFFTPSRSLSYAWISLHARHEEKTIGLLFPRDTGVTVVPVTVRLLDLQRDLQRWTRDLGPVNRNDL